MICLGEAPQRWTRSRHVITRAPYEDPSVLPTSCGPWHNGSNHFVTFCRCPDYWTILDPLYPVRNSYPTQETHLHCAITKSYVARGVLSPTLLPYKKMHRIATQDGSPLLPWACGTFAMSTTLHLLLGDNHPHAMLSQSITREHMLALHTAMLKWLLTGTPPFSLRKQMFERRHQRTNHH
jgi:hypothetical protein